MPSIYRKLYFWNQLHNHQYWEKEKQEALQKQRLEFIVKYAYKKVPFYKRIAREYDINIDEIKLPQDITNLPQVTRKDIQDNPESFISQDTDMKKLIKNRTSGSTGSPLIVHMDQKALDYNHALLLYYFWELGFRPWHKCANIRGAETKKQLWWKAMLSTIRKDISTRADLESNTTSLINIQPNVIYGFPSYITLIAQQLIEKNHRLTNTTVINHGETLYGWQREIMTRAFSERIFNMYGSTEIYVISFECEKHQGMHLITDAVFLELETEAGEPAKPGEEGNITITILNNHSMPLIRYKIGDKAIRSEEEDCWCGRSWPILIKEIVGREDDYFVSAEGQKVSSKSLDYDVFYSTKIKQFQIVQKEINRLEILIVKARGFDSETEKALEITKEQMKKALHNDKLEVQITYVDTILGEKSGKQKAFISKVASPYIDTYL